MALDHVAPNPQLMRELEQVAREAEAAADTLRGVNLLPREFPIEALQEISSSLRHLKDGTAEGCLEPLNFARHMLPLVRRDHFYLEGAEPDSQDDDEVYFTRDCPLDLAIMRLYGAVGTALDEYRSQAQEKYDDAVVAEETLRFGNDGAFANISRGAENVVAGSLSARADLDQMAIPGSREVEKLHRQLQDSANLGHSIQSQIRIRPVVARWYHSASKAMSMLPDILVKTADGIRIGADVAQIWHKEWSAFNGRVRDLAYDQIRGLASALEATSERLKVSRRKPGEVGVRQRDPDVVEAEKIVLEMLLSGKKLESNFARKVEILDFTGASAEIQRPEDLALLKNVKSLVFFGTNLGSIPLTYGRTVTI